MNGLDSLARRGRTRIGDISDTATDYDWGESQVREAMQMFESLGRPLGYEHAAEGIYAAYEKARVPSYVIDLSVRAAMKWDASTQMKLVGRQASAFMAELKASGAHRGAAGTAAGTGAAYAPDATEPPSTWSFPWGWAIGGTALVALAGAGIYAGPAIMGAIAAWRHR